MQNPADHAAYLARRDFAIPHPDAFTPSERDLLARYGRWLEALAAGTIAPTTPTQEQFVRVARGEREPETEFERAWAKVERERLVTAEVVGKFQALSRARQDAARLEAEYLAARAAVLAAVRDQLDQVDALFAEPMREANERAATTEQAVRELVLRLGRTVGKVAGIHASYRSPPVSWDNEAMAGYAQRHPEVLAFRKVGKPSVALRFADGAPSASKAAEAGAGELRPSPGEPRRE